jgi:hypothetical protein
MTVSRPRVLQSGDDIRLGGGLHNVETVSGTAVHLVDVVGVASVVPLVELLGDPSFELVSSARKTAPLPPSGLLGGGFRSRLLSTLGGGNGTSLRS